MSNDAHNSRRRRSTEQPTLKEVADAAGVSAITASRALNRPDQVNELPRARVLAAVERLGYVPNLVAGSLASARARFSAVICPALAYTQYSGEDVGMQATPAAQG